MPVALVGDLPKPASTYSSDYESPFRLGLDTSTPD